MTKAVSLILITLFLTVPPMTLFDFNKNASIKNWRVIDDVVMGGESAGSFYLNDAGHGVFKGRVSLENNGGFSSVRYRLSPLDVRAYSHVILKIKGDGKKYQLRLKPTASTYYSYEASFTTTSDWQEVKIPFKDMVATFRGRQLNMANYEGKTLEELAFLIGNKKNENFELQIDSITLE